MKSQRDYTHTQPHSTSATRPLKVAAIQCDEAGDEFRIRTLYLLMFLFFLPIYIFTYMH